MKEVFGYIVGLGAPVMMPIIFTVLGVCIGIKFGKALKSGLLVGVGFVGLSIVTALLTSALEWSGRYLRVAAQSLRHGVACCGQYRLQYLGRCIYYSDLLGY